MTWKKVVASVLAATLAFALAGCGSDKKEDKAAGDVQLKSLMFLMQSPR